MCGAHLNRLHSCLYCVFFGCFTRKHIHEHAKNKRHNLGEPRCVLNRSVPAAPKAESHHVCLRIRIHPVAHCSISHQDYSTGPLPSLRRRAARKIAADYCSHANALSSQMSWV